MINDDSYVVFNNAPLARRAEGGVLANDSDPDGGLDVANDGWFETTQGGSIYIVRDGSFVYLAPAGFFGTDTFVYTAEDVIGEQADATITFQVAAGTNPPAIHMADGSLTGAVLAVGQATLPIGDSIGSATPVALVGGGYVVAGATSASDESYGFVQAYGPDGSPVGGLFDIHADAGVHTLSVAATDGGYVVAWREGSVDSDEWPVQFQVFDLAGNPLGATRTLFDAVELNGTPTLFKLAGGNLAISINLVGGGTIAQIIEPDGDPVGGTFALVSTPGPLMQIADNFGGFFQLWRDGTVDGTRLWVQRLAADGTPIGPEIVVVEGVREGLGANLAMSADGSLVVTWTEYDGRPTVANVHARVFAPDGTPVGSEFVSSDFFSTSVFGAPTVRAFALANGGFVVAWERDLEPWSTSAIEDGEANGGTRAVAAMVLDSGGNIVSDEILVFTVQSLTVLGSGRVPPRIVALPDGGFVVVAQEYVEGVDPDMNVVLHSFDAFGNRIGNEALINGSTAGVQLYPTLAVLADGRLVGVWTGATDTEAFIGSQILNIVKVIEREEDQGPITIPLAVDIVQSVGPDSAVRIVIEGLPEGSVLTPPPGMTATFDATTGQWTLAGTIPDAFNLTLDLPQYFWGDVTMLATVYARDDEGTEEVASTPLAIRLSVAPDAAVIVGTPGNDTVNGTVTVDGQDFAGPLGDSIRGLAGRDNLSGLEGDDTIDGGSGGDTLNGDAGDDALLGHRGRDALHGGDDDDALMGGRGPDTLDGGAGNDRLEGGRGRDLLTGGEGVDTFVFTHPGKPDKITDFADGDIIALHSSAFANIGPAGALDAQYFHLGAEAETKQQKILYDGDTGWLLYAEKGSQTADPVKFAKIGKDLASFDAADVVVI
jgi:hypothetical protein